MNALHKIGSLVTIALLLVVTVHAQETFVLKSAKGFVEGTSSLHDWKSDITKIEWKGTLSVENNSVKSVKSAEVTIPVTGIKSTKGKIMDNKTYDAFLFEKNPTITFVLSSAHPTINTAGVTTLDASGYLTMAGTTKAVKLTASTKLMSNGDVQLTLSKKIKMTEFKMEKPTAMMGTITVGDEVTVSFDLVLTPATAQANKN